VSPYPGKAIPWKVHNFVLLLLLFVLLPLLLRRLLRLLLRLLLVLVRHCHDSMRPQCRCIQIIPSTQWAKSISMLV